MGRRSRDDEYAFNKNLMERLAKTAKDQSAHRAVMEEYPDNELMGFIHSGLRNRR